MAFKRSEGKQRKTCSNPLGHLMNDQNPMAFDLLAMTGDSNYSQQTLLKAADILLKAEKEQG